MQGMHSIDANPALLLNVNVIKERCHTLTFPPIKRRQQYVVCPEQDCEGLVYMSDQNTSMIESLGIHENPFWKERVEYFYKWFNKSSKTSKDAWT